VLKRTESNINNLKEKLGKKKFETLLKQVEPAAEEIVRNLLAGNRNEYESSPDQTV
jgi:hypothetical protein